MYDDSEGDEVELDGDTGDMLVMERALMIPPNKDKDWRQRSLFHTRCTITGKYVMLLLILAAGRTLYQRRR